MSGDKGGHVPGIANNIMPPRNNDVLVNLNSVVNTIAPSKSQKATKNARCPLNIIDAQNA
jgi:hypothetical protein